MYNNICDENKLLAKQNQELICNEKELEEENKELENELKKILPESVLEKAGINIIKENNNLLISPSYNNFKTERKTDSSISDLSFNLSPTVNFKNDKLSNNVNASN
jgi:hypothetical protein